MCRGGFGIQDEWTGNYIDRPIKPNQSVYITFEKNEAECEWEAVWKRDRERDQRIEWEWDEVRRNKIQNIHSDFRWGGKRAAKYPHKSPIHHTYKGLTRDLLSINIYR